MTDEEFLKALREHPELWPEVRRILTTHDQAPGGAAAASSQTLREDNKPA